MSISSISFIRRPFFISLLKVALDVFWHGHGFYSITRRVCAHVISTHVISSQQGFSRLMPADLHITFTERATFQKVAAP